MEHYNINAQNRKLKKQILNFLSRIGFGAGKLPLSGRFILVMNILLLLTTFFPWIESKSAKESVLYSAFSQFNGFIGYGILLGGGIMLFFLLSHTKKEQIRAYVPFRLSDTQAIIFVASMLLVAIIQLIIISGIHHARISSDEMVTQFGLHIALASVIFILISGFFMSKSIKISNTESYYLHHESSQDFGEYTNIIQANSHSNEKTKKENMSLPI